MMLLTLITVSELCLVMETTAQNQNVNYLDIDLKYIFIWLSLTGTNMIGNNREEFCLARHVAC